MTTDFRALCAELLNAIDRFPGWIPPEKRPVIAGARAALANEPAVPQPPTEGEVEELVAELRMMASQAAEACQFTDAENLSRAADLLQRWAVAEESSVAAPVPVSERLPGQEDCDKQGRCWIHMPDIGTAPSWRLVDPREIGPYHTHWLLAHALPAPGQEVEG